MSNQQEKRTAKGGGTVRQRPDGRWEARCTIGSKRRSFYADTQKEALKLMRAAQKEEDDGHFIEPSKMTVGEWLDIWVEEYWKANVKPSTYITRKQILKKDIIPQLGHIKLQSLTPTHIQTFYNYLRNNRKLQSTNIALYRATLHSSLEQALKLKYITINLDSACTPPRIKKVEIKPLSEEDIVNFLKAIEGHPFQALFTITLFTGMRIGEICGLSWDEIDFKNGTITIKQQLCQIGGKRERYYIGTTKNSKSRTITPAPIVIEILKGVQQEQISNHFKAGLAWKNEWNLVFTDKEGDFFAGFTIRKHFKRIMAQIERPDARFHDLRHTFAVMSLQEGDSPKTVQENLGHATARFTLDVYAHVSEKMRQESANRMQSYYDRLKA